MQGDPVQVSPALRKLAAHDIDERVEGGDVLDDDLGVPRAYELVLAPGAPERSVLLERMRRRDSWRMPPLINRRSDESGAALLEALVRDTKTRP